MLIVPPFMLQLGWVHVRVLSTREGQWGLFGGLWVCIIVNHPLTEPPVPSRGAHADHIQMRVVPSELHTNIQSGVVCSCIKEEGGIYY